MTSGHFADLFSGKYLPVGYWAQTLLAWLVSNYRNFFQAVEQPVQILLGGFDGLLKTAPPALVLVAFCLIGWQAGGVSVVLTTFVCLSTIGLIGAWTNAMTTLSIVLTAVSVCVVVGIPVGTVAGRNDRVQATLRPVLDFMQTIPSFVYLVPVVMLFGIGDVPGVIVTIFYAIPPVIRLTSLGIRQVRKDLVEASVAFGASNVRTLWRVQLPLAMPVIMTGVNQTIMMSLSMSVIASMISVAGLGRMVLHGIGQLDMAIATVGGLGVVLIAIMVDRISQGLARPLRERHCRRWYEAGPVGCVLFAIRFVVKTGPKRRGVQPENPIGATIAVKPRATSKNR